MKAYFETYGCQMNVLDSELALQSLTAAGFERTEEVREADLIVLNTCSVREKAEHRIASRLGRLKPGGEFRKEGAVLALMGCMGQRQGDELFRMAPHLDIVAGTKEFTHLPELYHDVKGRSSRLAATGLEHEFQYARDPKFRAAGHHAFVSIMRGCDLFCTYCIVPTTRGPEESRSLNDVVDEVARLVDDGVKEVTLLGQTVNSWGKQLPGSPDLADLIAALDRVDGLQRTRFITSHPNFFRNRFWERVAGLRTFCPYVHVPAQHGSDRVLKRMARLYTVEAYLDMVEEARAAIPGIALASDWIVGFPGETEEEHQQSLALMERVGFVQSFVFMYSPRPTTPSARKMTDDVPGEVKNRRCNEMLDLQTKLALADAQAQVGQTVEVLVDGPSKTNAEKLSGRTRHHKIVVFEGPRDLTGKLVPITIDAATSHTLYGALANQLAEPRKLPTV